MIPFLNFLSFLFAWGYTFVFFWIIRTFIPLRKNLFLKFAAFLVCGYLADSIIYANSGDDPKREAESLNRMRSGFVDAIIVAGTGSGATFTENGVNWQSVLPMEGPAGLGTKIAVNSLGIANY